ncbi:MAG: hypothetical protein GY883_22250 [Shimia sp.]|nr:hypothetical protein [Shimia sp.]
MNHPPLPDAIRLRADEHLIAIWRPAFKVFLRKITVVSLLTAVVLGVIFESFTDFNGPLAWFIGLIASAAFYAFIFDDVFEWRQRRDDHWVLTNQRLMFHNPLEDAEPASMSLANCGASTPWMGWSVRLRLLPSGAVILPYLRDCSEIAAQIRDAVTAHKDAPRKTARAKARV